jgi:hypothetical protein
LRSGRGLPKESGSKECCCVLAGQERTCSVGAQPRPDAGGAVLRQNLGNEDVCP